MFNRVRYASLADAQPESGSSQRYQRLRDEQVEGYRRKGWKTGKGKEIVVQLASCLAFRALTSRLGMRAVCEGALQVMNLVRFTRGSVSHVWGPTFFEKNVRLFLDPRRTQMIKSKTTMTTTTTP